MDIDFPMAEFTACVGFFLILFIEQIVLFVKELSNPPRHDTIGSLSRTSSVYSVTGSQNESEQSQNRRRGSTLGSVRGIGNEAEESHQINVTTTVTEEHDDSLQPSKIRAAILLLALSIHSVFEGLAVGLEKTGSDVFTLFTAIIVHKSVLAFSLGMSVVQSNMTLLETFLSVLGFASASPVGIAIGIIVSQEQSLFTLGLSTVLQGLATGTFLYITFFEILPIEFNCSRWRLQKCMCLALGFGVMCFLIIYSGD